MRVLIVSQYYPPEGVYIPQSVAQHLVEQSHSVRVLTGFPNYPDGVIYEGWHQRWRQVEGDGDVEVLRVPLWADHSQSVPRRVLNYASFALSSATARRFASGADVIYVYATQMTAAFAPWIWRILGGAPYVLHIQDLWPDSITGSSLVRRGWADRAVDAALTPWLSSVYHRASAVVGIAPTMVRTLQLRGVGEEKSHLVYNWAENGDGAPGSPVTHSRKSTAITNVLYAGNVGDMQDLETAVRAAHSVRDAGIRLTIVGDGVAGHAVRSLVAELGATNVDVCGRVERGEMGPFYEAADYALIPLKDLPAFRGTIPSKFQASVAEGLPVITTVKGDLSGLVDDLRLGFTADPEDVDSLSRALRDAAELTPDARSDMAQRAQQAHVERFSRQRGVERLEKVLADVVSAKDDTLRVGEISGD